MARLRSLALAVAALAVAAPVAAQTTAPDPLIAAPSRIAHATRLTGAIAIDGALDEAAWAAATVNGDFVQRAPVTGARPRFATEFRVVYGDDALYVGVRAFDREPAELRGLLSRRDEGSASDWIMVGIDSYRDRRTAYVFAINPVGVLRDTLIYDDESEDASWDAVWQGAARTDRDGWTAELRIPYNQLRFNDAPEQSWGLQVLREVARFGEADVWSPWGKGDPRIVSRFGEVRGLSGIVPPRRVELLPYAVGGGSFYRPDADDPLHDGHDAIVRIGGDFKLGLGSSFTVSGTINPDFGQVEADPSQVNLGAGELFFAEKRPFFVEGGELFRFSAGQGDDNVEQLFYTRRIGAAPHGDGGDQGEFVEQPDTTTILAAAKLAGKTASGWSFGLLEAVTQEEHAVVETPGAGPSDEIVVEPLASYAVARVRKDLRAGKTTLGAMVAATQRRRADAAALELHDRAYTGGLEGAHLFGGERYSAKAKLMGSWVHGSPEALLATQESSVHWHQRPDNDHVDYDPTRTALAGLAANGALMKITGDFRGALGFDTRTPGFEVNDLGFLQSTDYLRPWVWLQWRDDQPGRGLRDWGINSNGWHQWDYGGERLLFGGNVNGWLTLANQWGADAGVGVDVQPNDPGGLRGGPMLRRDHVYTGWWSLYSDPRRELRVGVSGNGYFAPISDSQGVGVEVPVTWRIASNAEIALAPRLFVGVDDNQYVDTAIDGEGASRYVMARIDQVTTALTLRAAYTVSPTLSVQLYAQPFVATGRYHEYKEVVAPQAAAYADRYRIFGAGEIERTEGDRLAFDRGADGVDFELDDPNFSFRQLRSNLVVRWEYRPGSTCFLIWSHDRSSEADRGGTALGRDLAGLAHEPGEHLIMAKLSYWLGL